MSLITNKKIAIVGGGPGGLTLARLLQMNGADIKVYERDLHKDARAKGATLDLHEESGLAALQAAGLMKEFEANYRPGADKLRIMDKHATIVLDEHTKENIGRNRPEIDRGPLQDILLNSLNPDTTVWNSQFVSLTRQNNSWRLEFKNGSSAIADIVIAADGTNSKVRPYITPIKAFYSGYSALEGTVYNSKTASPKMDELLKGGKLFAFGDNKSLIISSKGDGSLQFYITSKMDEDWNRKIGIDFSDKIQVLTWFKKEFTGWSKVWDELFENTTSSFIPRPLYCMPFDQTWEALPNLTILGDAAHLMPPFAGEGVNMAMLDALELSQCLTGNYTDIESAISSYEKQMQLRASQATKDSLDALVALHSPNAINLMLSIIG